MVDLYPSDDEARELFAQYGVTVYDSAGLEEAFVLLFATDVLGDTYRPGSAEMRKLMDSRRRQTLGRLLLDAKDALGLPTDVVRDLSAALEDRNWLIHTFHRETLPDIVNAERRARLVTRLQKMQVRFAQLSDLLMDRVRSGLREKGASPEAIDRETQALLEAIHLAGEGG